MPRKAAASAFDGFDIRRDHCATSPIFTAQQRRSQEQLNWVLLYALDRTRWNPI